MAKSLCITYFLWLFGGFFGLHHFYLGRDKQSFLWWALAGGYFGFGWFRDLWRIPEYVRDANDDPQYMVELTEKMRRGRPPFTFVRAIGQILTGNLFGMLVQFCIPGEDEIGINLALIGKALAPLATAFGIWFVGNIGREQGKLIYPVVACYLTVPIGYLAGAPQNGWMCIVGVIAFQWMAKTWRRQVREPLPLWKRILIITVCGSLYISMWSSYAYFNMTVTTKEGDQIKVRDAIKHLLNSPAVQEFKKNCAKLFEQVKEKGFAKGWEEFIDSIDPLGEKHAIKVLALQPDASQADIKSRYRELSKRWHPDKFQTTEEKEEAQEKFVEIQQAYEILSSIKSKRAAKNKRPDHFRNERTEF